ncbi:vomeronasal type-2 receptor 26-like [Protopterus annectens]|uniref:vomeronasal type-2 receptor 26-like n=1 Tax=Protopterus annectens TaxID=7888 RepID=UPI001CFB88CF|nr:vomeronasal type-2 receptor 26-like [Protopterus annectens]
MKDDTVGGEEQKLLHYVRNVHFWTTSGQEFFFDANGDPPGFYDILNWQLSPNGISRNFLVGHFDANAPPERDLIINETAIQWTGGQKQPPQSVCTPHCSTGYRKIIQNGQPVCCFDCIECSEGEIANQSDSNECWKCPDEFWPNVRRNACLPKIIEYLSYEDPLGMILATVAIFSSLIPLGIFLAFIKHHDTPIVKANNRELSYVLLWALVLCFLCSLIFIGQPNRMTCLFRQTAFGVTFVLCISCVLAKTIMVVIAFSATKPNSPLRKWVSPKFSSGIVLVCTLLQAVLCTAWVTLSSPYLEVNMKSQHGKIFIECNEGSTIAFWCVLGYMGLLASISLVVAFLSRTLPDSFNEGKYITFSMLVFICVWLSFIPAYLSTRGKYMVAVEIFAIVSSSASLTLCIFIPKCYIILLKPEMNILTHNKVLDRVFTVSFINVFISRPCTANGSENVCSSKVGALIYYHNSLKK